MAYTVSFQNRPTVSREHNRRNSLITGKEAHIDQQGHYEVWKDESLEDAYNRIFGASVTEYNQKQKRSDRQITNYLKQVQKSNLKNPKKPVYECIIQVGNMDNQPDKSLSREILKEFYDTWSKENPQMELIGAYFHADEQGTPHVHIDYVPVGEGYKRGLKKQLSLSKALELQGFKDMQRIGKKTYTPQQQWQFKEAERLKAIAISRGLEIYSPKEESRKHMEKEDFIQKQKMDKQFKQLQELQRVLGQKEEQIKKMGAQIYEQKLELEKLKNHQSKLQSQSDDFLDELAFQSLIHSDYERESQKLLKIKLWECAEDFLKERDMLQSFKNQYSEVIDKYSQDNHKKKSRSNDELER